MSAQKSLRRALAQAIIPLWLLSTLLMLWTGARLIANSPYPVMVVSSESMEPTFYRGDLIILWNRQDQIKVGDIPVVWFPGYPLPMVHRAIKVYSQGDRSNISRGTSNQLILTKGDNNQVDDTALYPPGQQFVRREEIMGLVRGYVPFLGQLSLLATDRPWIIYICIALTFAGGALF